MEAELKYNVNVNEIDDILHNSVITDFLPQPPHYESFAMRSVYYDTYEQSLRESKAVLRLRRANTRYFLTVKLPITVRNAMFLRKEWEFELKGSDLRWQLQEGLKKEWFLSQIKECGEPEDATLLEVLDKIDSRPLREVCGTDFTRRAYVLTYRDSVFELAIDQGYLFARDRHQPFAELELELKDGNIEDLRDLNQLWLRNLDLTPNQTTKYERAIILFDEI